MELKIKPHSKNTYPLRGLLIKSSSVASWIKGIEEMKFSLAGIKIYPVPNVTPNSIWGCLLLSANSIDNIKGSSHELCQLVSNNLLIPERSIVYPATTDSELEKLFASGIHIFHPEVGLVELSEALDLEHMLSSPREIPVHITIPDEGERVPKSVRSFQVHRLSPEEILKNLTENIFPKQEKKKDDSLSFGEKIKLGFYRTLFSRKKDKNTTSTVGPTSFGKGIKNLIDKLLQKGPTWDRLQQNFEDLEARNQKQIDKLMDLLKKNPDEALKYAIPLDDTGATRGGTDGRFELSKRWFDFSVFHNDNSQTRSGVVDIGDHYHSLQNQYIATAEELIKKNEYQKAAFIYMKLLKNYSKAADALELGKYYQEAAIIHIKHSGNKLKAAECYEKGNLIQDAIGLYKELNNHEKAGDLYMKIHDRKQAIVEYEKVVNNYKLSSQYLKASLVCREKMNDPSAGQRLLLEGWNGNKDATNCLRAYLSNVEDIDQRWNDITSIYTHHTSDLNQESFLDVLKHEYKKKSELTERVRELAYEIVAAQIPKNPAIATELKDFNPNNTELRKDALRFKLKHK